MPLIIESGESKWSLSKVDFFQFYSIFEMTTIPAQAEDFFPKRHFLIKFHVFCKFLFTKKNFNRMSTM
jgi:hypothetical protein